MLVHEIFKYSYPLDEVKHSLTGIIKDLLFKSSLKLQGTDEEISNFGCIF